MLLLQGDLRGSLHFHAFAPIFLFLSVALVGVLLVPKTISRPIVQKAELFERKTGLTVIILSGLILYWLARLLFLNSAFVQLIRG